MAKLYYLNAENGTPAIRNNQLNNSNTNCIYYIEWSEIASSTQLCNKPAW